MNNIEKQMHDYFDNAANGWTRYRKRRAYYWDSITQYVNYFVHPANSVIEIGCGTGELIIGVNGTYKVGIDFSEKLIKQAKDKKTDVDFFCMAAEDITLNMQFDVVILSNLIGFLGDIDLVLNQIRKLCHAHTRVIVTSYNRLWEPMIRFAELIGIKRRTPEQNWISKNDLTNMLYLAGFETYRTNSNMLLPFGIPLLAPFFNRLLAHLPFFRMFALNNYHFARPRPRDDGWENRYSVSVIIPARNESGNIEDAVRRVPEMGAGTEIIFVEGNSTDDTWETVRNTSEIWRKHRKINAMQQTGKGKGDAVRKGFAAATGDILMILDADLTVAPEDLPKFYKAIAQGKGEFINGVRLVYPMENGAMRSLNNVGNHFFSRLFSWILETPVKDTLCGTKVMFREDYQRLAEGRKFFGDFDPFGDFDLLFGAHKLNLKIVDLPIRYRERKYGSTNISRFRHGLILLKMSAFAAGKIRFR